MPDINRLINDSLTEARTSRSAESRARLEAVLADANAAVDDQQVIAEAAALPQLDYDRLRKAVARRLNIRPATLDAQVERARALLPTGDDDTAQGSAINIAEAKPWDAEVAGDKLLDELSAL